MAINCRGDVLANGFANRTDKTVVKCRLFAIYVAAAALAAGQVADPLASLSLEQLLAIKVTSVAKKQETLERAAAAVFVITQEDIRRLGATSIPEALRLAPGLHVVRINSRAWAITARGFNSVFGNKLLVLIDGRSIYSPMFAGVWWDQDVMLDDVDRIEVIRGPVAAMWGANAVNGVINIITRDTSETVGNLLSVTAGSEDRSITRFRHGATFGKTGSYRVYGQYSHRALESPVTYFDDTYWGTVQGGFRLSMEPREGQHLMLQGDIAQGVGYAFEQNSYPIYLPNSVSVYKDRRSFGGLLGRWTNTHRSGAQTTLQAYYDGVNRTDNGIFIDVQTADVELQHRRNFGQRHELTFSTGYRGIVDHTVGTAESRFYPPSKSYGIGQLSAVDSIPLWRGRFQFTYGARLEHNPFSGWSIQPTGRGQWSISRSQSVWGAVSRAIRAPSRMEGGFERLYASSGFGFRTDHGNTAETLVAFEAGYRGKLRKNLTVDIATFRNRYDNLRSTEYDGVEMRRGSPVYWFSLLNLAESRTWGAEGVVSWDAHARWRLSGSYTGLWMKNSVHPGSLDVLWAASSRAGPVHQWQAQSSLQLRRNLHWNTNLFYYGAARIDKRLTIPLMQLAGQVHIDTRVAYRREATEWSAGVRNVTGNSGEYFVEPGPSPSPTPRAYYLRFTWWF
ncbi:MAG: TonB-dependent receptor plug domain-containing protein [Acidobacteria bacterium]|nr:TonB-dependent receptor plug domain-containing protein [Acidobacteriota bacterium]